MLLVEFVSVQVLGGVVSSVGAVVPPVGQSRGLTSFFPPTTRTVDGSKPLTCSIAFFLDHGNGAD